MGIEKSEIKMLFSEELGNGIEDLLDAAKEEVASFKGAKQGLVQGAQKVEDLTKHLDIQRDEGKITQEEYVIAKEWIVKAAGCVRNLATQAEVNIFISQGKVQAYTRVVENIKKIHDIEKAKVAALKNSLSEIPDDANKKQRVEGTHPGLPLSVIRKAEEAKEYTKEKNLEVKETENITSTDCVVTEESKEVENTALEEPVIVVNLKEASDPTEVKPSRRRKVLNVTDSR